MWPSQWLVRRRWVRWWWVRWRCSARAWSGRRWARRSWGPRAAYRSRRSAIRQRAGLRRPAQRTVVRSGFGTHHLSLDRHNSIVPRLIRRRQACGRSLTRCTRIVTAVTIRPWSPRSPRRSGRADGALQPTAPAGCCRRGCAHSPISAAGGAEGEHPPSAGCPRGRPGVADEVVDRVNAMVATYGMLSLMPDSTATPNPLAATR